MGMKLKARLAIALSLPLAISLPMLNVSSWRPQRVRGAPFQVAFSPDGRRIALASHSNSSAPGRVELWDFHAPTMLGVPRATPRGSFAIYYPGSLCFSGDSQTLIAISHTGLDDYRKTIRRWNAASGAALSPLTSSEGNTARFAQPGTRPNGDFQFWTGESVEQRSVNSGQMKRRTKLYKEEDYAENPGENLAFSPDGQITAWVVSDSTGALILRDAAGRKTRLPPLIPTSDSRTCNVTALTFSPDSRFLVVAWNATIFNSSGTESVSSRVTIWNLKTRQIAAKWTESREAINAHAFSPDGALLAAARDDGAISVRDAKTGALQKLLQSPMRGVASVAFSPDGTTLASCGSDGALHLWRVR